MAEIVKKKSRMTEEEIAAKRAERAKKKAEAAVDDNDDLVCAHTLKYTFSNHVIDIEEDWSGEGSALAGMQWLGGVTLARYFDNAEVFPHGSLNGKRILEVGAGVGLTSILLALLGADVTLTDIDINKAIPNIELNIKDEEIKNRIQLSRVDWFQPELERFTLPYDMIVAGECCYETDVIDPLLHMLWDMSDENTIIYLCGIVSDKALVEFNLCIDTYFTIEVLDPAPKSNQASQVCLEDIPENRIRALMRLHRKPTIMSKNDSGTILIGPEKLMNGSSEMEIHLCKSTKLLQRELNHIFPEIKNTESTLIITTNQHSSLDLVKLGPEVDQEKDRCLEFFMAFAKELCGLLRDAGYWADYIDPCSGLPMLTPNTTKCYSEVEGMQSLLRYKTMNAGTCKVMLHPQWGSSVYPASAFTDAPQDIVSNMLKKVMETQASWIP